MKLLVCVFLFVVLVVNVSAGDKGKKGQILVLGANTNGQSYIKLGGKKGKDMVILGGDQHDEHHKKVKILPVYIPIEVPKFYELPKHHYEPPKHHYEPMKFIYEQPKHYEHHYEDMY